MVASICFSVGCADVERRTVGRPSPLLRHCSALLSGSRRTSWTQRQRQSWIAKDERQRGRPRERNDGGKRAKSDGETTALEREVEGRR